ncbi:MAG: hypothetical protein IID44_13185 [Planctomycetes bacterium]|nr:hypothetical protein [Planctomycetota bacterium]
MAESFDAYHEWLGIAPKDQPPNHYQLLGIDLYESKANVIDGAADRQMAHLRTFQTGARSKLCQELLNQVSTARVLLLDAQKKAAYDEQIRMKLAQRAEPQPRIAAAIPLSQPARAAPPAPIQAAVSAPQFGGVSSRRRARRKQNTPWLAVGIGGAVLGVVVVIVALATMGDGKGDETANAAPAVRPSKSNSADPTKKPAATAAAKPADTSERKPTGEPLPEKRPDEDDPAEKEPAEKDPPKESPVDSDTPFEIVDDEDPPADDGRRPVVTKRPAKPAVPSAAAREKAGAEIRKVFDIDAVPDVAAKAKLARELLAAALDTADDPASQYVMLRMVRDTAATHGDYAAAERAIDEMSQRFEVDVIAMRSEAVVQALAAKKIPTGHRKRIVRDALRVVQECHQADRYKHAKKSIAAALKAATSLRDKPLLVDTRRLRDDGKVLAKQYEAVRGAFETLKTKPNDPAANTAAGKYLCYVKADWKRGLAMLAQGNDALLKDLATREQRGVTKFDEQIALADAWWKIADEQPNRNGGQVRAHAGHWYKKALPNLTGLDKVRVAKRIKQTDSAAGDSGDSKKPRGRTLDFVYLPTRPNWQRTGFTVEAGQTIRIQATGTITLYKNDLKKNPYGTADGLPGRSGNFKGVIANAGGLLLKIGQALYRGGTDTVVTVKTSGEIELGISESGRFSNNAGKFLVRITIQ